MSLLVRGRQTEISITTFWSRGYFFYLKNHNQMEVGENIAYVNPCLTCKLRNDGRRVLVQVVHTPSDGIRGHGHTGHDHPAVVRVQGGCQTRQAAVVDHREVAELLDLLPAVQSLLQTRRHLRQGFSGESINQSIFSIHVGQIWIQVQLVQWDPKEFPG